MPNGIQFFYMFPSPLGDEVLKPGYIKDGKRGDQPMFPSPFGDEVLKPFAKFCPSLFDNNKISFRPLSGMRCLNLEKLMVDEAKIDKVSVPSRG